MCKIMLLSDNDYHSSACICEDKEEESEDLV